MDILTFISTVLVGLAWPITVVVLVSILKKPLETILPQIKKLQFKDLNIEFDEIAKEAKEILPKETEEVENYLLVPIDTLRKIASISPRAAIVEAYSSIEHEISASIERVSLSYSKNINSKKSINILSEKEIIDNPIIKLLNDLIRLRNDVVHNPELEISQLSAEQYIITANSVCKHLKSVGAKNH